MMGHRDEASHTRPIEEVRARRPATYGAGRTCDAPGCETVLSRYNGANQCARHKGWPDPPPRRRRRAAAKSQ